MEPGGCACWKALSLFKLCAKRGIARFFDNHASGQSHSVVKRSAEASLKSRFSENRSPAQGREGPAIGGGAPRSTEDCRSGRGRQGAGPGSIVQNLASAVRGGTRRLCRGGHRHCRRPAGQRARPGRSGAGPARGRRHDGSHTARLPGLAGGDHEKQSSDRRGDARSTGA